MQTIYEFRCTACDVDWTIGLVDSQSQEWVSVIHCPCCGDDKPFLVGGGKVHVKHIETIDWRVGAIDHLQNNKHVAAIRHCREITGWGLKEAKDATEALPEFTQYKARTATSRNPIL